MFYGIEGNTVGLRELYFPLRVVSQCLMLFHAALRFRLTLRGRKLFSFGDTPAPLVENRLAVEGYPAKLSRE